MVVFNIKENSMIIFSVSNGMNPCDDSHQTQVAINELKHGPFKTVVGFYKGQSEVSFLTSQKEVGKDLAKRYNQGCYLERGHYGYWYLIETKTDRIIETFKTIKEVTKDIAVRSDSYIIVDGKHYLASKY